MNKNLSARSLENFNVRSNDDGKKYIEGYAIVFNQKSKLIREWGEVFYEVIEPTAADNVLNDPGLNVIAAVEHKGMLGRTKSGTLKLIKDEIGVKYVIDVPDTQLGRDTVEHIKRGDYFESSFIFGIADKGVRYDTSEEIPVRYISNFSLLRDISIVIDGAYAKTIVKLRNLEQEEEEILSTQYSVLSTSPDILQKEIDILKL